MRNLLLLPLCLLALGGCGAPDGTPTPAPATGTPAPPGLHTPPPSQICHTVGAVYAQAQTLILTTEDAGARLHQISAAPLDAAKLGIPPSSMRSGYVVVYSTADNSQRVVSQVVVTVSAITAEQLLGGTVGPSSTTPPPVPALCDHATTSTVTVGKSTTYAVSWQHGNVFAEVVEYSDNASAAVIAQDLNRFGDLQDAHIRAALVDGPPPSATPSPSFTG